jgi:hypothetical protein
MMMQTHIYLTDLKSTKNVQHQCSKTLKWTINFLENLDFKIVLKVFFDE